MELSVIENKIYEIRGVRVMFDFDLAEMYGIKTGRLKEQVRRNIERFPSDFMIELNLDEWKNLRTQFAFSSWGGNRYLPYAFTEQGVAMLSSVLSSKQAIEININIMRVFVAVRSYLVQQKIAPKEIEELRQRIDDLEDYNKITDEAISDLYMSLTVLAEKASDTPIRHRNTVGYVKPKNIDK
ncbi:ORF6N domain-containing protein [Viscerimonas tarda]